MTRKLYFNQSNKYPFDLGKVLYAAQDFRWCKWDNEWHSGVLAGNLIHIRQVDSVLEYKSHSGADLDVMLRSYFRLCDPIDDIYDQLASRDSYIAQLVKKYHWLRVLRQPDSWECTVSYICSATNNVDRISGIVEKIAENFGGRLDLDGDVRFAFPTRRKVLRVGVGQFRELSLGLDRHCKIITAAERIRDGQLNLSRAARPEALYHKAKGQLTACYGIGNKVADCIALFGLDITEAFPVDVHIGRALAKRYGDCPMPENSSTLSNRKYCEIVNWAQDRFGKYAGFANQFLFHEERENSQLMGR
ncbi:MAG: DNA glycosylase [Chloroflexi bacterium]|nr:DNA glycosylase [Chloroflexota bacterium]